MDGCFHYYQELQLELALEELSMCTLYVTELVTASYITSDSK